MAQGHASRGFPAAIHDADDVDGDPVGHGVEIQILDPGLAEDAGTVHQRRRGTECGLGLAEDAFDVRLQRHIPLQGHRTSTRRRDLLGHLDRVGNVLRQASLVSSAHGERRNVMAAACQRHR